MDFSHEIWSVSCVFLFGIYSSIFSKLWSISIDYSIEALESIQGFEPTFSRLLSNSWYSIDNCLIWIFRGYLRYKNGSLEAHAKNFFFSQKSYVPFSRYSSVCIFNHLMIYQICDVMMGISTWDTCIFE